MFYRQKINELCYMYRYVYGKMSRKLSVRRPSSSFSRIRLDRRLAPRFSSRLPGLPHRFCLLALVGRTNLPFATSASSSVGQLQQSKYRAAIFAQSLSQGKQLLNYCVPQYFPCQHTSTYRVCSITTVVSPSSVHLLLFFVVDCTSHEAPVCIGGHRSRGGPVSQC